MLNNIKIKNFKCFVEENIAFNNLTILVGANGVGKSTIIQSILIGRHIIESSEDKLFKLMLNGPYLIELGQSKDIICSNAQSDEIVLQYINGENDELTINLMESEQHETHYLNSTITPIKDKNSYLGKYFRYLNAERLGPRKALDKSIVQSVFTGYKGEYTAYAIGIGDQEKLNIPDFLKLIPDVNKFSRQVEAWLNNIMKNVQFNCRPINELNVVSLNYKNEQLDTEFYPANSTGFGISYILPIIVESLFLASKESSVIVIENPEAHLHPYSQSKLGKFLALIAKAGVQVILETHSEHIINGARIQMAKEKISEKLLVNYINQNSNGSYVESITLNEFGELSRWPTGFFDQEENDLQELFMIKMGKRN